MPPYRLMLAALAVGLVCGCGRDRRGRTNDGMPDCDGQPVYHYWYGDVPELQNHGSREAATAAAKEDGCTKTLPKRPEGTDSVAACCPANAAQL